jgi:hypothetical protein
VWRVISLISSENFKRIARLMADDLIICGLAPTILSSFIFDIITPEDIYIAI